MFTLILHRWKEGQTMQLSKLYQNILMSENPVFCLFPAQNPKPKPSKS